MARHGDDRAAPASVAGLLLLFALAVGGAAGCAAPEPQDAAGEQASAVAVLEVPLQSTDAAGRVFRLTGTLTLTGPESSSTPLTLSDASAADAVLTLSPRTGTYEVTLSDWGVHEWDAPSASFALRADATPIAALTQTIAIVQHQVSVARFSFHVPMPSACSVDNGGCDALVSCDDSAGSVVCGACPAGYAGDGVTGCTDLDECALGSHTCTGTSECANLPGSFECLCPEGWLDVNGDGSACQHVRAIATGSSHACAINEAGALYCWGQNGSRQLGDGTTTSRSAPVRIGTDSDFRTLSVGDNASCAIKDSGELWCWGGTYSGHGSPQPVPTRVGTHSDWFFAASFSTNTCALRGAGEVYCWGNNASGQIGIGSTLPSSVVTPTRAGTLVGVTRVAMGNSGQTCAVRDNGELWCWGYNGGYQLGDGTNVNRLSPTLIDTGGWTDVAAGQLNTCGIKSGGLYCWGADGYGVLGDGTAGGPTATTPQRVGVESDWTDLAMGHYHICAIRSGERYCWGYGGMGQLGQGVPQSAAAPLRGDTSTGWTALTAALQLNCGVRDGEALCWGENSNGTLGNGVGPTAVTPKLIDTSAGWSALSAGYRFNCGVKGGELWCWGEGQSGKLGHGATTNLPYPTRIGTASNWSRTSAAISHACGLRTSGELYCWGGGGQGQLGDGSNVTRTSPVQVVTPFDLVATADGWSAVTTGYYHSCGINHGALYCWGGNSSGQRGDANTLMNVTTPLRIGSDTDWTAVDANFDNTCGLRGDQLYCWGSQVVGVQYTITPQHIPGSWSAVSAGSTLCGVQSDGALYCWGGAYLGNGSANGSGTPLRIGTDSDWLSISTGNSYACGRRSAGLTCWGGNTFGQLGDNTMTARLTPVVSSTADDWSVVEAAHGAHACGLRAGVGALCWGADTLSELGDGYAVVNPTPTFVALP